MTTPAYAELVAATRSEGEALLAAARLGLDQPVPTCPGWHVGRLVLHVGRVYHYAASCVADRATEDPGRPPSAPEGADPVAWCGDALEEVVDALASTEPGSPVWNWSVAPQTAAFWARRMAHESAVHRWDVQNAHGVGMPIVADLAVDAVAELVEVLLPRLYARGVEDAPQGVVRLVATDNGAWRVQLSADGARFIGDSGPADAAAEGTASDLVLALYGRLAPSAIEVTGDAVLLDRWQQTLRL